MAGTMTSAGQGYGHGGVPVSGPAPGYAGLRVGDQDRERVVEHVQAAYAEGRLDRVEFDDRLERAMTARVHGDLIPIMNELYGTQPVRPAFQPPATSQAAYGHHGHLGRRDGDTGADRLGAAAAHMLSLAGLPILGPLVMMLTAGKTSPYIRAHSVEALNFQLTLIAATIVLAITVVGVVLTPLLWIGGVVLSVIGGVAAMGDGDFRYPLTLRLVK
ncbi:DUF1707 and DUF4870 domain-containing protein [Streptosporangium sp. NBC_01810]|uniref:DUF1707 and DUF4870 domain-containing protein n=1 Tax=Streptosporangium sp. NBC_01810 TaxID=2975951 RepID=UPI002DD94EA2|nr:DUF1707 and DUF4870 domain-containing protein [Streptosporangium sp. NBC_01810]WSA27117.1 DUF1707 and DUF4870 domain-containing protein [Streptosporangium sp. NBC_01810]